MFVSWDLHVGWIVLGGAALLAMTVLPQLLRRYPLSLPAVYIAVGFTVFEASDALVGPRPSGGGLDLAVVEYVTELVVIISLVGAGLRIDRRPGLVRWHSTWRLLAITMPLTIVAGAALGLWLGLAVAPAILLGAVIAPTDPVLADDVQVGPPGDGRDRRDEVRLTLTAEAGLNDGLAFPFVHLAIAASSAALVSTLADWAAYDVGVRVTVGVVAGAGLGWLLNRFARRTRAFFEQRSGEGLFVLGATLSVYGLTEVVNGYGFLAVFVAALVRGGDDEFRRDSHEFVDQIESVIVAFVLLGFGAAISEGILDALTWRGVVVAAVLVLVVRPLTGLLGLIGRRVPMRERLAIAFFGIRGIGSLYYLAYALGAADFGAAAAELWAVVALTILVSVAVHGFTASPVMRHVTPAADTPPVRDRPGSVAGDRLHRTVGRLGGGCQR